MTFGRHAVVVASLAGSGPRWFGLVRSTTSQPRWSAPSLSPPLHSTVEHLSSFSPLSTPTRPASSNQLIMSPSSFKLLALAGLVSLVKAQASALDLAIVDAGYVNSGFAAAT